MIDYYHVIKELKQNKVIISVVLLINVYYYSADLSFNIL